MPNPSPDFLGLLRTLTGHSVDFIIVGGVSAVMHGAPVTTFDLDVAHSRRSENIAHILAALKDLDAFYRGGGSRRLKPTAELLASPGHQLLMTRLGPLDLPGIIGADHDYEDLLSHSAEFEVSGLLLRVLNLETLIKVKEEIGFEKDKAVLPLLRRTLQEKLR